MRFFYHNSSRTENFPSSLNSSVWFSFCQLRMSLRSRIWDPLALQSVSINFPERCLFFMGLLTGDVVVDSIITRGMRALICKFIVENPYDHVLGVSS